VSEKKARTGKERVNKKLRTDADSVVGEHRWRTKKKVLHWVF